MWHFQMKPTRTDMVVIDAADVARVEVAHTLPKTIDPEINEATTWTVEYGVPVDVLSKYCPSAKKPGAGVIWKVNLYKCGDNTSHPHWLTWSLIDRPQPEFHVPEYFGTLAFK